MKESVKEKYESLGVNTDVRDRAYKNLKHHPKTKQMLDALAEIDLYLTDSYFSWNNSKTRDTEILMYELDVHFEYQDKVREFYTN